ncbi:MAG: PSD1 and planctomycete cytochrome C domain-containing protein [Pirellulales bacterium]
MRKTFRSAYSLLILLGLIAIEAPTLLSAEEAGKSALSAKVEYSRDIKPVLKDRCYACHGVLKQEASLRLDTLELALRGGESGPAIVKGDAVQSRLLQRVLATDAAERMPPEGHPLSKEQIEKLQQWISDGAPGIANERPEEDPRDHWAFCAPVRAALPITSPGEQSSHPIDAFILARLKQENLAPRPLADKPTLLRRVTLDLIGLPPTREELHAFMADNSPTAYETVVDRLLMDPRHGERWGRHWMDVWRYADWHGRRHVPDVWNSAPQVWRWRDWIVRSLNADHGYDRMVREMLAADEVAAGDEEAGVATGYLIRNWYALNPNDWMRANVEHTSKAFLGLTFHCAHCHDHKYDPISQDDYFRLRAFFEPINIRQDRVPGEADPGPFQEYSYSVLRKVQRLGAVRVFDKAPDAPTWFYTGGDERNRVASRGSLSPGVPQFLAGGSLRVEPVALPAQAWYPGLRPEIQETQRKDLRDAIAVHEKSLGAATAEVNQALPALRERLVAAEKARNDELATPPLAMANAPLVGKQSLVLHAVEGRRCLQNRLSGLSSLESGTTLRFQLQIVQDAHVNFQLAKDVVKGLTAGYVAFEQGQIRSYQPGGFTEFQAGKYDFAGGQRKFEVTLILEPAADRCLLAVRSLSDDQLLVEKTPVALNGWNPVGDPLKAISLDARTGCVAAVDEWEMLAPQAESADVSAPAKRLFYFDFEPPKYVDKQDVAGIEGWEISSFGVAPATSRVATAIGESPATPAQRILDQSRRAVAAQELRLKSLEAKLAASRAELAALEARIAAEQAKHGLTSGDVARLAMAASQQHRQASVLTAEAQVLTTDQLLAAAESKPLEDMNRAKETEAASKQLAAARAELAKAQAALADPKLASHYPPLGPTYPATSTGRRRALADWITSAENPLAARVAVNHLWLRHFHSPLVASVFDFGRNGARPSHPELLDWLAVELRESGWSMKRLHRLMVTSAAYRRVSSVGDMANAARDPENKLYWRMNVGRMEAEVLRDSLLYVSGRLDPKMGGQELENKEALTTFRRSLYYSCQPEIDGKSEFSALFDAPEPADCYRRTRSVIPQQALALTNSILVHDLSGQLAAAIWSRMTAEQQTKPTEFVTIAYEQVLGRTPTATETALCVEFLQRPVDSGEGAETGQPERRREAFLRVMLNHNDFIAIR